MRTTRRRSRSSKAIVPVVALAAAVGGVSLLEAPVSAGPIGACSPTMTTVDGDTVASFITEGLCTWTIPAGASNIDVLVVGGGGSGGRSSERSVGGGGGGGVADRKSTRLNSSHT